MASIDKNITKIVECAEDIIPHLRIQKEVVAVGVLVYPIPEDGYYVASVWVKFSNGKTDDGLLSSGTGYTPAEAVQDLLGQCEEELESRSHRPNRRWR